MEKVGHSVEVFLERSGLKSQLKKREYLFVWEKVAGEHVAQYTRPVKIKEETLFVEVNDSIWVYHLNMLQEKIIDEFNEHVGSKMISKIKFINEDFYARELSEKRQESANLTEKNHFSHNGHINLAPKEEEEIERALQLSPEYFRNQLRIIFKKSFLRDKWKKEKGAISCRVCNDPFFKKYPDDEFCPYCLQKIVSWMKILKNVFYNSPWIKYNAVKEKHPFLDERIFSVCKKTVMEGHEKRILKTLGNNRIDKTIQIKILKKAAHRYVLLAAEKEPPEIEEGDIVNILGCFPGLNQLINS
ncbi:MAG: DUF721 domain-containing protein [Bacillota bacterium]|nr:DUF721 domain-containing protein [Bacillota bacterium]